MRSPPLEIIANIQAIEGPTHLAVRKLTIFKAALLHEFGLQLWDKGAGHAQTLASTFALACKAESFDQPPQRLCQRRIGGVGISSAK